MLGPTVFKLGKVSDDQEKVISDVKVTSTTVMVNLNFNWKCPIYTWSTIGASHHKLGSEVGDDMTTTRLDINHIRSKVKVIVTFNSECFSSFVRVISGKRLYLLSSK